MNLEKIRNIEQRLLKNRKRLQEEKDQKKKNILRLRIGIDELKIKIERLQD
jgi:hypothetical protein